MILGTAGHIDHGKTALVRALTGVDTDRLPEEKRRGITIELGFAPLQLEGVGTLGVVDVPGHEAFVRTMLAGAAGIDLALLVVAADEGVMPQTREHLAILDLLGIRGGVVALTKCDLVDGELLALAVEDVAALLEGSGLHGAVIVPVSSVTGEGLDALRAALREVAASVPARDANDAFRMPVDRVFTVKGTGTVVTGTVWSGRITRDDTLRAWPGNATSRVRGVESHGRAVAEGAAGQRLAIAVSALDRESLSRGAVLVNAADAWVPTDRMRADVALLDGAGVTLSARTRVRLHLGTSEVGARVVARGGRVASGETMPVRLVLDAPLIARGGDRFVLRTASPLATIGGGVITDPAPSLRRVPPFERAAADLPTRLAWMVAEAGPHGLPTAGLALRLGVRADELAGVVEGVGDSLAKVGTMLIDRARLLRAEQLLLAAVDAAHAARPLDRGTPLQPLRSRLGLEDSLAGWVINEAVRGMVLTVGEGLVARAGWAPRFTAEDRVALAAIEEMLQKAGREPPTLEEISKVAGPRSPALIRLLEREGRVVAVGEQRFLTPGAWGELLRVLRDGTRESRSYSPGEIREIFGVSRKFSIPLIEGCDRMGVSSRVGDGRVFHWHLPNPAIAVFLDSAGISP
ncbi:MAG: selenocysteine-specific translation elongation factor [Gemmatimonadaceae bacterium]